MPQFSYPVKFFLSFSSRNFFILLVHSLCFSFFLVCVSSLRHLSYSLELLYFSLHLRTRLIPPSSYIAWLLNYFARVIFSLVVRLPYYLTFFSFHSYSLLLSPTVLSSLISLPLLSSSLFVVLVIPFPFIFILFRPSFINLSLFILFVVPPFQWIFTLYCHTPFLHPTSLLSYCFISLPSLLILFFPYALLFL